jgi:DNA polymerase
VISNRLQDEVAARLEFYRELGIEEFFIEHRPQFEVARASRAEPLHAPDAVAPPPEAVAPIVPAENSTGSTLATPRPPTAARSLHLFQAESPRPPERETLDEIQRDLGDCQRCKLAGGRKHIVFGQGNPHAELVFVGEGPGADEDEQGLPFVGRAGQLLNRMLQSVGIRREDAYICNVVKCRPPENRTPEPDEVATCSPFLYRQLEVIQPKVIVCLGAVAAKTLLNTTRGISQYRGEWLDWRGHKLMATYHPAYLLRNPPAKADVWKDLQKVMAELGLPLPKKSKS